MTEAPGKSRSGWFTIPAHRPFLQDLAAGIWRTAAAGGPEALAETIVLLPTRRAARDLAEAFLTSAGTRAVILRAILPGPGCRLQGVR